ncbi:hypothetical protein CDV31_005407 [Fusarium ambrosium]|uniref:Uncharacterized protein n=1 Tax=Fusarium ambrosium TaxID=131363 RepID=A0A428UJI2_9HYPO|nr:hypothetical protein CDV31_005407 [Fusarium ambrosium]
MSRRYNTNKTKGKGEAKKATTLNEGFTTDVSGRGGDGSPAPDGAITIEPEDIEEE